VELPGRIRHVRRIEWAAATVVVRDRIEGRGTRLIESRLVWAPDRPPVTVRFDGEEQPVSEPGWLSDRIGERVPTSVDLLTTRMDLPAQLGFRIGFEG
jgi:hypothetical protein